MHCLVSVWKLLSTSASNFIHCRPEDAFADSQGRYFLCAAGVKVLQLAVLSLRHFSPRGHLGASTNLFFGYK